MFIFSASKLREIRETKGLSREDLAQRAASSYPAILSYESGNRTPPRATILRLAAALGVHPSELVDQDPLFAEATS